MIHALKPLPIEPNPDELPLAQKNPAVAQCREAWERARQSMVKKKKRSEIILWEADRAYCRAMPPLVGYENICNFIACVGYGMLTGRFENADGTKLLYAAQVALSTVAPQSKTNVRIPVPGPCSTVAIL
jgi:hypothetical protein